MLEFQTFIKSCNETCYVFVLKSIQGLNFIKNGLIEAKEGDFDYSIKLIRSTSKIADLLANEAKNKSMIANDLAEKSGKTLLIANHNRNEVIDKNNKEKDKENEMKVKKDILQSEIESYGKNIEEFQKKADEVVEREKNKSILDKIINIFINHPC